MKDIIKVFPSSRAIRAELLKIDGDTIFLPKYITMSEFITKLCVVDGYKMLDEDSRTLLLLEASNFSEFSSLQIERNFFTFTKNSSYIFKFFSELSAEMYDISSLDSCDIYAEYEEHISILKELYRRYEKLCSDKKVLDKIFTPKLYTFNESFASSHKEVEIFVDGHLTNFEFELLLRCSHCCEVVINFNTSIFNSKMVSKFEELGVELEPNYEYSISLNEKKILSFTKRATTQLIEAKSFSESLMQVAFIKHKVYEFMQKGYRAHKIAVVLPDESMALILKSFDDKGNFNFAMGDSFTSTKLYEKLDSTLKVIGENSKENLARVSRVGDEIYDELKSIYHSTCREVDIVEFLNRYVESSGTKVEQKIFKEEIYSFSKVLEFMQDMSIKAILTLFLSRLASRTIDDVRGGKITVMGLLETRMVEFDGVIIVDFSDNNVPKRSDKDMFLNTKLREIASLPTMNDRENLQKHYYQMLIDRTKEVSISYVKSEQSVASRFLKQLNIETTPSTIEKSLTDILFEKSKTSDFRQGNIEEAYSFKNVKLSASRLKTFLDCKRKYYYRYVLHVEPHNIPQDMPQEFEIGITVHNALEGLYSKKNSYLNVQELQRDLERELDSVCGESELDKYLISLKKRELNLFCQREVERFKDGWVVKHCEKKYEENFAGMRLIGQIDRVDKRANEISILDYKTGSIKLSTAKNFTEAKDFQLEFYHILASGEGNIVESAYYDLTNSKIIPEAFLKEKLAILESHIKDLLLIEEINFIKCEDEKSCLFCEFKVICERG